MLGIRAAFGLLAGALLLGCANNNEQQRFRVSGSVTFDGKPIPYGEVLITPDAAKKNSGAQAIAQIRDGRYDTSTAGGKGYGGGPAIIRVTGFDRAGGKLLCEQEFPVELPREDTTHDLKVPKEAKAKGGKSSEI
jgi:hypothetical protein